MRGFYGFRGRLPKRTLARIAMAALAAGAALLAVTGMGRMRALLTQLATSRATNMVNQIVADSANAAIAHGDFAYDKMIAFEKDNTGKITAVKSNMPEFNRLQSAILREILDQIDNVSSQELAIPLGSLTGSSLLAGRGPHITVRMQSIGSSKAKLENAFVSAGINQTKHQIFLNVDVYVNVLLPGFRTATKVSNSVVVAETIIVGSVPDSYTYFDASDSSMEDTARDYIMNNG